MCQDPCHVIFAQCNITRIDKSVIIMKLKKLCNVKLLHTVLIKHSFNREIVTAISQEGVIYSHSRAGGINTQSHVLPNHLTSASLHTRVDM